MSEIVELKLSFSERFKGVLLNEELGQPYWATILSERTQLLQYAYIVLLES
jgi:hypothetical protein